MKMWNPGDARVENYMSEVSNAIKRYHEWPSDEFTDIYNRSYEAVLAAITDKDNAESINDARYWIEYLHSEMMSAFHEFRLEKVSEDECNVSINGSDLSKIIAKSKIKIYKRMNNQLKVDE